MARPSNLPGLSSNTSLNAAVTSVIDFKQPAVDMSCIAADLLLVLMFVVASVNRSLWIVIRLIS